MNPAKIRKKDTNKKNHLIMNPANIKKQNLHILYLF